MYQLGSVEQNVDPLMERCDPSWIEIVQQTGSSVAAPPLPHAIHTLSESCDRLVRLHDGIRWNETEGFTVSKDTRVFLGLPF